MLLRSFEAVLATLREVLSFLPILTSFSKVPSLAGDYDKANATVSSFIFARLVLQSEYSPLGGNGSFP